MSINLTKSCISEVDVLILRIANDPTDIDCSTETAIVRITDGEGRVGIGEADAPPEVVRDLVMMQDSHAWSKGLRGMLIGRDPFEIRALYNDLYDGTQYHGRRGIGIHALSAVDIALYDLVGKQLGRPVYQLLGGVHRQEIKPYAPIYPGKGQDRDAAELMKVFNRMFGQALDLGFRAFKMEIGHGEHISDPEVVTCIKDARKLLGGDVTLMLDFGDRWTDWRDALWVLRRVEDCRIFFAEGTLQPDDIEGHYKLAQRIETRLGGGEMAATVYECREWLERGKVDVLQPDLSRCGGLTEARRIADLAALYGAVVIPHGYKTGISAAASRHFQAATLNCPYISYLVPDLAHSTSLRKGLTTPEPGIVDGILPLPNLPGLGVDLVKDVVKKYTIH